MRVKLQFADYRKGFREDRIHFGLLNYSLKPFNIIFNLLNFSRGIVIVKGHLKIYFSSNVAIKLLYYVVLNFTLQHQQIPKYLFHGPY